MKAYWNGSIVDDSEVHISPWDLGFLRGFGVFDYFAIYDSKPFMIESHFARFQKSAELLSIPTPVSRDEFIDITEELIRENDLKDSFVRVVLTGGVSSDGITRDGVPTFLMRPEAAKPVQNKLYEEGGGLVTIEYMRDTPEAKTIHYAEILKNAELLVKEGANEILFTNNGYIFECSRSNIFLVRDAVLITPNDSILFGITRSVVLEEAGKESVSSEERRVRASELLEADEVFITGTAKGIVPIVKINNQVVSTGVPGTITRTLMNRLDQRKREHA